MEILLSIVLFFILISYILGKLLPFLLKLFIANRIRKAQNGGMNGGFDFRGFSSSDQTRASQNRDARSSQKEGDISINRGSATTKKVRDNVGEYVDFENVSE